MATILGKIRRSALVTTFAPGAVVDFRKGSAPVSGIVMGLEAWDSTAPGKGGLSHEQTIREPRLQKQLGVRGFRLPPVQSDKEEDEKSESNSVPVVRFPFWLQCPKCNRLKPANAWQALTPGADAELICPQCSDAENTFVVPVRFVTACQRGHIDDFPWARWAGCICQGSPDLRLITKGAGLGGRHVECRSCRNSRSLEGVFGRDALKSIVACTGNQPWLDRTGQACPILPRVLQRGASNIYWGLVASSLDIPPFSSDLSGILGKYAEFFEDKDSTKWEELLDVLEIPEKTGIERAEILAYMERCRRVLNDSGDDSLERGEYVQLSSALTSAVSQGEFRAIPEQVPAEISRWIDGLLLVERLREVRAVTAFTRINPPSGPFRDARARAAHLSITKLAWLPAVELLGEGIFIRFTEIELLRWEKLSAVQKRVSDLDARIQSDLFDEEVAPQISARFVMIHSFAHALMRRLSLECGYSSAALRERLYVDPRYPEMRGVLIMTGTPDSEGTLGGLVAQGKTDRFLELVYGAIVDMSWCSQDPVCITGTATLSTPRNGAACHACELVPETSCQHFNTLLDRALLMGTPDDPALGYFSDLRENI